MCFTSPCVCVFMCVDGWERRESSGRIPCVRSGPPHIHSRLCTVGVGWGGGGCCQILPLNIVLSDQLPAPAEPLTQHLVVINTQQSSPVGAASANRRETCNLMAVQVVWYSGRRPCAEAATRLSLQLPHHCELISLYLPNNFLISPPLSQAVARD